MIKTFVTSFKLRNTYKANTIIYSLKSLPLIKKMLSDSLYASKGLKTFANVIGILIEINGVFLGKALYLSLMVFGALQIIKGGGPDAFVHIFFFLTIAGGLLNTHIFNPSKDKYYAMFLMRIDAREYTLSNYLYFLLKMAVGLVPFTLLFGLLSGQSIVTCLIMPLFVCGVKLIVTAISLHNSKDGKKIRNENLPTPVIWVGVALSLVAAYGPLAFGYSMNGLTFGMASIVAIVAGSFCLVYVLRFREYRSIYRTLLTVNNFALNSNAVKDIRQQAFQKKIEVDLRQTSNESGYKYFNEIFMKRHSKMLTKSAKKITFVSIAVLATALVGCSIVPEVKSQTNELILTSLPLFLFVMYFVNRGRSMTMALFMNCDHSMLTYRFYRQPKTILALFAERLKYMVAINLLPASVIAIGLPLLLYISGGTTETINYGVLFVTIMAMSVFFSVHTLVLYYLLQPYNINMEIKNATYVILNSITYSICFLFLYIEIPSLFFGMGVSAFCVLYASVALFLAYRLAPKTFKLKN